MRKGQPPVPPVRSAFVVRRLAALAVVGLLLVPFDLLHASGPDHRSCSQAAVEEACDCLCIAASGSQGRHSHGDDCFTCQRLRSLQPLPSIVPVVLGTDCATFLVPSAVLQESLLRADRLSARAPPSNRFI
jgi:hypothetical protein